MKIKRDRMKEIFTLLRDGSLPITKKRSIIDELRIIEKDISSGKV